jgi:hypothetical protein
MVDLAGLIKEWCEAQAAYDRETTGGGGLTYVTHYRLYCTGRALYRTVGLAPVTGRYAANPWFDRPTPAQLALLDRAGMR